MTDKRDKFECREETKSVKTIGDLGLQGNAFGVGIPEGATHKMNGSFYKGLEQSGGDLRLERIKVQVWNGVQWCEVFLNDDAPLVEIRVEPYKPVVGEWCEVRDLHSKEWRKAQLLGVFQCDLEGDEYVFIPEGGRFGELFCAASFRPIKTEREQFIERAMKATNGDPINSTLRDLFDDMFQAGFKGPDKQLD